jgi:hypothetical protein
MSKMASHRRSWLSLRRHRLVLIGILILLNVFWSLKRSLSSSSVADTVATIGSMSSWLHLLSSPDDNDQGSLENRTRTSITSPTFSTSMAEASDMLKIDIISIGSIHRPDYQNAQAATFGSHQASGVRHFLRFDETNDVFEPHCSTNLTMSHVQKICAYCRSNKAPHNHIWRMRKKYARFEWLAKKANAPGWMCVSC